MRKPDSGILLLGGTAPALTLARQLIAQDYSVIYSIAGLVRQPDLSCEVVSGGFTQFGGIADFIRARNIGLVIDATHPYAAQISTNAALAAEMCAIPCWRLQRAPWQAVDGDSWFEYESWERLLPALQNHKRVFLSQGHLSVDQLAQLTKHRQAGQQFFLRTAIEPKLALPDWMGSVQAIGPFSYDAELALFQHLQTDVLVSKNSGGDMTAAKLEAARTLGIPVLFLQRPALPPVAHEFFAVEALLTTLQKSCTLAP